MPANTHLDETKLNDFMGRAVSDMGAAISASLVRIGDRLGLYKAMAGAGPMSPADLAKKSGTVERYVREWLNNQAAGGYVTYDPKSAKYSLPAEQAAALADESSPFFILGAYDVLEATSRAEERIAKNFKTGDGMDWGEHHHSLFHGTERFFRPNYVGNLVSSWIPALDGVKAKLERGCSVADVGCGHGASTILMAQAFPKSKFVGFDSHEPSVKECRERAKAAGVADRTKFEVARAQDYPGLYDFVTFFDCLHDMADPAAASKHTKKVLKADGTWMIIEPFAEDQPEKNLNPVGRTYYAASTMVCVPVSLAGKGPALGAQAGEGCLRDIVVKQGGFSRFRRATQTPFNLVLEARP